MLKYKEKGYRIPLLQRRCKFLSEWDENQAPLGSHMNWPEHFAECSWFESNHYDQWVAYAVEDRIEKAIGFDNPEATYYFGDSECCNCHCAGFQSVQSFICDKHDIEYEGICPKCEDEYCDRMAYEEERIQKMIEAKEDRERDLDMQYKRAEAERDQYRTRRRINGILNR